MVFAPSVSDHPARGMVSPVSRRLRDGNEVRKSASFHASALCSLVLETTHAQLVVEIGGSAP